MNIKQKLIAIAIAVVFVFFVGYGIEVFHQGADRTDYCGENVYEIQNKTLCEQEGGQWIELKAIEGEPTRGSCSEKRSCYEAYNQAAAQHDKVVFITALIISILTFIGATQLKQDTVSSGLMGGALLLLLYGTIRYWQHTNDVVKFVLLGVALSALVYIPYKRLSE